MYSTFILYDVNIKARKFIDEYQSLECKETTANIEVDVGEWGYLIHLICIT